MALKLDDKPDDALGAWRFYYAERREVTREFLDPRLLKLIEPPTERPTCVCSRPFSRRLI
jgi:hypothetical protein